MVGYRAYLESIASLVPPRRLLGYEIGQERERAKEAIRLAQGRPGRTGVEWRHRRLRRRQAGLELLSDASGDVGSPLNVEVVPGVTAASAAGALLGAPLMLDFAAISLSDLLVPWETIEHRIEGAAGDLTVVLCNPASVRRRTGLARAVEILRQHRPPTTPVGLVRKAYRPEQSVTVTTLADLPLGQVDMKTVLVIGCSRTEVLDGPAGHQTWLRRGADG